jgi:hypothetical protein
MNTLVKPPTHKCYQNVYCELYAERINNAIVAEWEAVKHTGCHKVNVSQDVVLCMWKEETADLQHPVMEV